ncbi:MAG: chaperone modulator CbpM [Flavobacteriaceae bacterium]
MENSELISVREIVVCHDIDNDFMEQLETYQLVEFVMKDANRYIYVEQLPKVERFIRLHYDLDINLEGIEVIKNMLDKMETMQGTIRQLQNRLTIYEQ